MGKIIAIANQKGGVGKTTTCINLACYLGHRGKKTLLFDVDPQGNATSGLGLDKKQLEKTVYDVVVNNANLADVIQHTAYENLDLCPSNIDLAGAEIELVDRENRETYLKKALSAVKDNYDVILIDCPPSLGLLTINALTAADSMLIPIQAEYYALEGLGQLTETYSLVKQALNTELDIIGILITMYDTRTQLAHQVEKQIYSYFPDAAFKTIIPRNVRLSEAPSYGKPIIAYDKWSRGARAYNNLAKELIKRL